MNEESFATIVDSKTNLVKKSYSDHLFRSCKFVEDDWCSISFESCLFSNCALELVNFEGTKFQDVCFKNCKITGGYFYQCHDMLLEISFDNTKLISCNFSGLPLVKSSFIGSTFKECYFNDCNLRESDFSGSSFPKTIFNNTDLTKANFKDAKDYMIDPTINKISKATFAFPYVMGLLKSFDIKIVE